MVDHHVPPDYVRCLPIELHSEANAFIRYLRELPATPPHQCPQCGHPHFSVVALKNVRLPSHRCAACNTVFNGLSKCPFPRYGHMHMHLWPAFAQCLLAGWSIPRAAKALGISSSTTGRWIEPCRAVMANEFPALFHWWSARQDRTDLTPPPNIAAQAQTFLSLLEHLLRTRQAVCSWCGSLEMQRVERRSGFYCYGCCSTSSLVRATVLSRLRHPEYWLVFAKEVINGASATDLQRSTGLCEASCKRWQVRFIQMMDQQGHAELIQWMTWLRSRRVKELQDIARERGQLEAVTGSRFR